MVCPVCFTFHEAPGELGLTDDLCGACLEQQMTGLGIVAADIPY